MFFAKGARTALSASFNHFTNIPRGQGCPRSFLNQPWLLGAHLTNFSLLISTGLQPGVGRPRHLSRFGGLPACGSKENG